jgi:hypothetical protein
MTHVARWVSCRLSLLTNSALVYESQFSGIGEGGCGVSASEYSCALIGCPRNKQQNISDKQNCFKTNRNNPKFSVKYQNMLSIKLFWLVFCSFRLNRNIKTLCFSIEPKQPKQTVSKQTVSKKTKTNRKKTTTPNFKKKIPKYALYHTVSVALLFVSVQSKHRNSLFRYRTETTETNVLFRIVPKLVSKDTVCAHHVTWSPNKLWRSTSIFNLCM